MQSTSPPLSNTVPVDAQYPPTTKFCQDAQLHRRVHCKSGSVAGLDALRQQEVLRDDQLQSVGVAEGFTSSAYHARRLGRPQTTHAPPL